MATSHNAASHKSDKKHSSNLSSSQVGSTNKENSTNNNNLNNNNNNMAESDHKASNDQKTASEVIREWKIPKKKARLLKALTDTGWEPEKMLHKLKIYSWDKEKAMARYNRDDFCHFFCIEGHCRSGDSCKYGDHSLWIGELMTDNKKLTLAMHLCEYLFYFNRFGNNAFNWRNNASLHGYYAMILSKTENMYRDINKAEKHFITALELNPNHSRNLYAYVDFLRNCLNNKEKADYIQANGYHRQNPLIETTMYNQNELHDEMSMHMQAQLPADIVAKQVPKSQSHHNFNAATGSTVGGNNTAGGGDSNNLDDLNDDSDNEYGNNNNNGNNANTNTHGHQHSHGHSHNNNRDKTHGQTEFILQKSTKHHSSYINSKVHSTMASAVGSAAPAVNDKTNTNSSNNNNNKSGVGASLSPKKGKTITTAAAMHGNENTNTNNKTTNNMTQSQQQQRKILTQNSSNTANNNNNNNSKNRNVTAHVAAAVAAVTSSGARGGNSGISGSGIGGTSMGNNSPFKPQNRFYNNNNNTSNNRVTPGGIGGIGGIGGAAGGGDAEYGLLLQKNSKQLHSFYEEWFNNDGRSMAEILCCIIDLDLSFDAFLNFLDKKLRMVNDFNTIKDKMNNDIRNRTIKQKEKLENQLNTRLNDCQMLMSKLQQIKLLLNVNGTNDDDTAGGGNSGNGGNSDGKTKNEKNDKIENNGKNNKNSKNDKNSSKNENSKNNKKDKNNNVTKGGNDKTKDGNSDDIDDPKPIAEITHVVSNDSKNENSNVTSINGEGIQNSVKNNDTNVNNNDRLLANLNLNGNYQEKLSMLCPIPEELRCPLTRNIMKNPVCTEDGYTFERDAIENYFNIHGLISPVTGQQIESSRLIPNRSVKDQIHKFLKKQEWSWIEYLIKENYQNCNDLKHIISDLTNNTSNFENGSMNEIDCLLNSYFEKYPIYQVCQRFKPDLSLNRMNNSNTPGGVMGIPNINNNSSNSANNNDGSVHSFGHHSHHSHHSQGHSQSQSQLLRSHSRGHGSNHGSSHGMPGKASSNSSSNRHGNNPIGNNNNLNLNLNMNGRSNVGSEGRHHGHGSNSSVGSGQMNGSFVAHKHLPDEYDRYDNNNNNNNKNNGKNEFDRSLSDPTLMPSKSGFVPARSHSDGYQFSHANGSRNIRNGKVNNNNNIHHEMEDEFYYESNHRNVYNNGSNSGNEAQTLGSSYRHSSSTKSRSPHMADLFESNANNSNKNNHRDKYIGHAQSNHNRHSEHEQLIYHASQAGLSHNHADIIYDDEEEDNMNHQHPHGHPHGHGHAHPHRRHPHAPAYHNDDDDDDEHHQQQHQQQQQQQQHVSGNGSGIYNHPTAREHDRRKTHRHHHRSHAHSSHRDRNSHHSDNNMDSNNINIQNGAPYIDETPVNSSHISKQLSSARARRSGHGNNNMNSNSSSSHVNGHASAHHHGNEHGGYSSHNHGYTHGGHVVSSSSSSVTAKVPIDTLPRLGTNAFEKEGNEKSVSVNSGSAAAGSASASGNNASSSANSSNNNKSVKQSKRMETENWRSQK